MVEAEVTVRRPHKMANVRVIGLEESVTPEEVAEALDTATGEGPACFKMGWVDGSQSTRVCCTFAAIRKSAAWATS